MEKQQLEEFRRAAGMPGTRYPEFHLDEKKAAAITPADLDATIKQFDHDYSDLRNGMQRVAKLGGEWTDQERSAILRLRADLDAVEKTLKGWGKPAKAAKLPSNADPAFAEAFAKNMMAKGQWTRSIDEWQATMVAALQANLQVSDMPKSDIDPKDDTYNEFKAATVAKWLKKWAGKIEVQPAREYSVALYIKGDAEVLKDMEDTAARVKADEIAIQSDGTLRLWWD